MAVKIKLGDEDKTEKTNFYREEIKTLYRKVWELEGELKYQQRWLGIDINKKSFMNGQLVPTTDYISALNRDIEYAKGRIVSDTDLIKEIERDAVVENALPGTIDVKEDGTIVRKNSFSVVQEK